VQLNTFLDFAGIVLLVIVFVALYIVHFGGDIITGRARKRFIKWQWSLHELPTGIRRSFHLNPCYFNSRTCGNRNLFTISHPTSNR